MDELSIINRPYKRSRLHYQSSDVELNQKRARHDLRLKSRFEEIFQRYEKDFSETADEIDLDTGEIVVNNGHLAAMIDEFDLGPNLKPGSHQQPDVWITADDLNSQNTDWINSEEEDIEQQPQLRRTDIQSHRQLQNSSPTDGYHVKSNIVNVTVGGLHQGARLDRMVLESAWQAPPLPGYRSRSLDHPESPSINADESEGGRSPSPSMGSLWAPMAGRGRPKLDGPATQRRRPPPRREPLVQLERSAFGLSSHQQENTTSCVSSRLPPRLWSQEENELLMKLKTTTQLVYREMEPYFPGRKWTSIAIHWSRALLCGERDLHLNGGNNVEPMASTESEEGTKLHGHSSETMRNNGSSSTAQGILGESKLPSKLPIKPRSRILSSSIVRPVWCEQRLDANSDYDDELGDYPLEKKPSTILLTSSSPVAACSRTNPVVFASKTIEPREAATPMTTIPQVEKQLPLNRTHSHRTRLEDNACSRSNLLASASRPMKPQEAATPRTTNPEAKKHLPLNRTPFATTRLEHNDELSDSCELGLSPPLGRASAPSYRVRTGLSAATPVPFRTHKRPCLLRKATTTPKLVVTEDSSEDELATPVKTIGTSQASAKKLFGSSRRSTSHR